MAEYLSPGVYVEEFESGGRPMEGVSTSTAGFIGLAERGSLEGNPVLVTNISDFKRKFGGYLSESEFGEYRFLASSVEHFFLNGGARCFVMRVAPKDSKVATNPQDSCLKVLAKNPGAWANKVKIVITPSSKAKTQIMGIEEDSGAGTKYLVKSSVGFLEGDVVVFNDGSSKVYNKVVKVQDNVLQFQEDFQGDVVDKDLLPSKTISTCEFNMEVKYDDVVEEYENVSFNVQAPNFIEKKISKSDLIEIKLAAEKTEEIVAPYQMVAGESDDSYIISLIGGSNGTAAKVKASDFMGEDNGPGKRTGIQSFIDNGEVSIMAIPGITDPNVQLTLVAHCENLASRFAILDIPKDSKKVDDVINHRNMFDSDYVAMYHPWLEVYDMLDKKNTYIPPSGSIAGIYARSDQERGVQKAPANEVIRGCVGLDCTYNKGEQDILNPKGVNIIRSFVGQGIRVWGARTCSSNSNWKYINVRRLFIFLEESIKANTNWAVFEPNDELLWVRVKRTIDVFLTNLWRNGALAGSSSDEAFFVDIGRNTMTQDDIDNGRLICVIGVAPVKPAEFVIFRITQKVNEQQ
ncbi:phage tail sheath family protein [Herbivorax sp. ANBcel31]|uniref:phage tail sheath family protein n=1 Tax=Herbivorax sp. ANBcel31 TaxID=3069754 RepID=UPI0027B4A110|nr:phage tail sheath family protein [Herbivorax sp. ANBcel31]MDQ2085384.1 phage tail sheath family protein [Herbivorax sp. ANBcel31]